MMLPGIINDLLEWTATSVMPAAQGGGYRTVADKGARRQTNQERSRDYTDARRQHPGQRNDTREPRKLQAEDDHVVLLCRD